MSKALQTIYQAMYILETIAGEPVKFIGGDVCEYKQAHVCIDRNTGQPYGPSPYTGITIRNKVIDYNTTLEEALAILPEPDGEPSPEDKAYLDRLEEHLDDIGNEVVSKQLDEIQNKMNIEELTGCVQRLLI